MIKQNNTNSPRHFVIKQEQINKKLFSESNTQSTRFKTFIKIATPNVFESKLNLNLRQGFPFSFSFLLWM